MDAIARRIELWLWPDVPPETKLHARGLAVARYVYALLRDFWQGELSLRAMSILLLQNSKYDEGLAMTGRWIDADPRNPEPHRWRALALADVGQMPQAIAEMEAAVRLSPQDANLRNLLADMLDSIGRTQEAAAVRAR